MNALYPAAATCLALLLYTATMANCGRMRARHKITAPATTGHIEFEKAFRVQMNTLEAMVLFLPAMWLYAAYVSELWAAAIGVVWITGRAYYAFSYQRDPVKRGPGMTICFAAAMWLLFGGIVGIVARVIADQG